MSLDFDDVLAQATRAEHEERDIDTSFLERHRVGGPDHPAHTPETEPPPTRDNPLEPEHARPSGGGATASGTPAEIASASGGPARPDPTPDPDRADAVDVPGRDLDDREPDGPPISLRHDEHQNQAQDLNGPRTSGGSGSRTEEDVLPQVGFRLMSSDKQPAIRLVPEALVSALREQVRATAVRELGVTDSAARRFSEQAGQGALVTGFLMSGLDVHLEVDDTTAKLAELFSMVDPLLGQLVAKVGDLQHTAAERDGQIAQLRAELSEVRSTAAVVEQSLAYLIADRTENFLRGGSDTQKVPITDRRAVFVRDRARELTERQRRTEVERDGRPIR